LSHQRNSRGDFTIDEFSTKEKENVLTCKQEFG